MILTNKKSQIILFIVVFQFLSLSTIELRAQISARPVDAPWTQHMIKQEDRFFDFKAVAKGTQCEHRFVIKNPFQETVHISGVSSSCTCTTAYVENNKDVLQTYEETAIVAHLHTDRFDGQKNATITINIDKPYRAELQLNVKGEIRSDITVTPNWIRFGNIKDGEPAERTLTIAYSGSMANWKITDFHSDNKHLSAEILDAQVRPGLITSKVKVKVGKDMPKGEFIARLALITNDSANRREIPVIARGTVGKSITVSPQTVFLGFLEKGKISPIKTATVRGTAPFKITKLLCNNPDVQVDFKSEADAPPKLFYSMPLRYTNPEKGPGAMKDGKLEATVQVETDDPNLKPSFKVTAQLKNDSE